jgi:membrane associated rhomboid family serine protease
MPKLLVGLTPLVILLFFFTLFFVSAWRQARRNRYKISLAGTSAPGIVTDIGVRSRTGECRLDFTYQPISAPESSVGSQMTTQAAIDSAGLRVGSALEVRYQSRWPRSAFADSVTRAERIIALGDSPAGGKIDFTAAPPTFFVTYTAPAKTRGGALTSSNELRWYGSGDVTVTAQTALFAANQRRAFWFPKIIVRQVALQNISNVEHLDNSIRLECILEADENAKKLQLWTIDSLQAERLVRMLPTTKTASFSPVMAERAAFQARLIQITPSAPITPSLIAINVLMFVIATSLGGGLLVANPQVMIRLGTDYTPLTLGGQWWRLLTSTFLHFGLLHILFNMWALYVTGLLAERIFGSVRYLLIYLVAGIGGSLASLLWHPIVNGAGASGAIFGVLGALIAFFVKREGGVPASVIKPQLTSASIFVAYSLLNAARYAGIDNAAHIGGLLCGLVMGFLLFRPMEADRDTKDWTSQWAAGLGLSGGAAILIAHLMTTGAIAPRIARDANGKPIPLEALGPPVRSFAGFRLGMTSSEILQSKGDPIQRKRTEWLYNAIDPRHDGVVSLSFASPSDVSTAKICTIEFIGDRDSAPTDLPFLRGLSRAAIIEKYGEPLRLSGGPPQMTFLLFRNGIFVALDDTIKVRFYGIFDLSALR